MGAPNVEERFVWRCLVGLGIALLLFLKQETQVCQLRGAGEHGEHRTCCNLCVGRGDQ